MRLLFVIGLLAAQVALAQDVHVRVSPDVKTGIEGTTEFPTIQMAMDHHPFAGVGKDGGRAACISRLRRAFITSE